MKLHEFQAKDLLAKSGIPTPQGQLVKDSDQASKVAQTIPGPHGWSKPRSIREEEVKRAV